MGFLHQTKHPEFVEGCFGCKAGHINLATGDANSNAAMAQTKWDKELAEYRSARDQGIQPAGTTLKKVRQAVEISNRTGRAYDASNPVGTLS